MPTPKHILKLREKIGHDLIISPGAAALVFNDAGEILLHKRADFKVWAAIGGILDPGETPAETAVREVLEETGVHCVPVRISGVYTTPIVTYPNGDQAQFVITAFVCRATGGEPRVNDDESLEVGFFPTNDLPAMREDMRVRIEHAILDLAQARFFFNGEWS